MGQIRQIIEASMGRWEDVGMLSGLCGEIKEKVADAFDTLAYYLLNRENCCFQDNLHIYFPILRRVMCGYPQCNFTNPADFVEYVESYAAYYKPYYENLHKNHNIDPEAQCCADCSEQMIKILKAREEDGDV